MVADGSAVEMGPEVAMAVMAAAGTMPALRSINIGYAPAILS